MSQNEPIDEPDNHIELAPAPAPASTAQAEAPKRTRSGPRPLSEKLEELATSARNRLDKLKSRELKLTQDLGKVRGEIASVRAELEKITGTAERVAPPGSTAISTYGANHHPSGAPF